MVTHPFVISLVSYSNNGESRQRRGYRRQKFLKGFDLKPTWARQPADYLQAAACGIYGLQFFASETSVVNYSTSTYSFTLNTSFMLMYSKVLMICSTRIGHFSFHALTSRLYVHGVSHIRQAMFLCLTATVFQYGWIM